MGTILEHWGEPGNLERFIMICELFSMLVVFGKKEPARDLNQRRGEY